MFIVDTKLKERANSNNPIRVGITGAGFAAKSVLNLIEKHIPGMTVTVVCNRTTDHALSLYQFVGIQNVKVADSPTTIDKAVGSDGYAVTNDYESLCQCNAVDIIVEITGSIEYGANVLLEAFKNGKDVLSFNAELDSTVGPILSVYAKRAGVLYSGSDGDQPGVTMNLFRYVQSIGLEPLLAGNVKGLHDPYRNPDTQAEFAKSWGIGADKATAFADGTKLCMEQTCVANAVGFKVAKRGMLGYEHRGGHIDEMTSMYDIDMLKSYGGIIEYALGAKPGPGVFIYATTDDPFIKHQLKYLKLGEGPLYSFYTPYHLCFSDVPNSIARVVDFRDCVFRFDDKPTVEVVSIAKKDLKVGDKLDGYGKFTVYGECENSELVQAENLLPIGLADNVSLNKNISKDSPIGFKDIDYDPNNILFKLYKEQIDYLAKNLPEYLVVGEGRKGGDDDEHMAIFIKREKFRLRELQSFQLSKTPEIIGSGPGVNPRMVTWVRLALINISPEGKNGPYPEDYRGHWESSQEFYIFNTHYFNGRKDSLARLNASKLIHERVSKLNRFGAWTPERPVFLMGDFNCRPGSAPHKILVGDENSVGQVLFHDTNLQNKREIDWILYKGSVKR